MIANSILYSPPSNYFKDLSWRTQAKTWRVYLLFKTGICMLMPFTKWITIPWMVWTISVRSASAFVRIRSRTIFSNPRNLPSSSKYRIAHLNVKWCDNKGCLIFRSHLRMLLSSTLFLFYFFSFSDIAISFPI